MGSHQRLCHPRDDLGILKWPVSMETADACSQRCEREKQGAGTLMAISNKGDKKKHFTICLWPQSGPRDSKAFLQDPVVLRVEDKGRT